MSNQQTLLENAITHFHLEITPGLNALADALDEAAISHYSSGCGVKKVTFDIFPASGYVRDMLTMVSLARNHRSRSDTGLRDATRYGDFNPANQFMQYLRRWTGFAEEVMQREGDSARGVAAARAKLIMGELMEELAPKQIVKNSKLGAKIASLPNYDDFFVLMHTIGLHLESHKIAETEHKTVTRQERLKQNYERAMAAATGKKISETTDKLAA